MIVKSLKSITKSTKAEDIQVIYRLIFKNAFYSMECFVDSSEDSKDYCYIEDITDDEGEAETFLKQVSKGKVLPIHIKDIAKDYFSI